MAEAISSRAETDSCALIEARLYVYPFTASAPAVLCHLHLGSNFALLSLKSTSKAGYTGPSEDYYIGPILSLLMSPQT